MVDSRDINELNPIMKVLISEFLNRAKQKGIPVVVTSTYRDAECQNKYYNAKPQVTTVKGNYSFHQWRIATDIVPADEKGNPTWSPKDPSVWGKLGAIAGELGLEWGGSWTGFVDKPHYQCTFGYTCGDFVKGTPVPTAIKKGCLDKRIVKAIQGWLNKNGASLVVDGIFGNGTESAVKKFQESKKLAQTGFVDDATLKLLF